MGCARNVPAATSSATDTVLLALSTQSTTPRLATATATMDTTPTSSVSAPKNAEPTNSTTPALKDVLAFLVWAASVESVPCVLLELRLLLTEFVPTAEATKSW